MNYRHGFHAGNFADVFKHALLARLLVYLARKATPFRVIDTHAGEGVYDLASEDASRTMEWRDGVGRLADMSGAEEAARALLQPYLQCVGGFDASGRPQRYPGSPQIAATLLRAQDRAVFCELRPDGYAALRYRFSRDERIKTVQIDGYVGLRAYVPPKERRGLVLIDPPFERADEHEAMFASFIAAYEKWPTGVFALWRPIKDAVADRNFVESFARRGVKRALSLSLDVGGAGVGLRRTGLIVVNPPFVFADEAHAILGFLVRRLGRGDGAAFVAEPLAGE